MKAIGLLFYFSLIPFLDGCLVVRSKQCECPLLKLNKENLNLVSDHSFHGNLTKYSLKEPMVAGDNCSVSISCADEDYQLVILDNDSVTNFGAYPAEAACAVETQTWLVDDSTGFKTYQSVSAVCVKFDSTQCTPQTPTTFLFAYSNDIEPGLISSLMSLLESDYDIYGNVASEFTTFAHARFDLEIEEEIKYHSSVKDFFTSINSQTPSPSSTDSSKGSDILKVLEKHVSNTRAPICGSRIVAFAQLPILNQDTENIVNQLLNHHISLFTVSFSQNDSAWVLTKMAAQTQGYGTISNRLSPLYSTPFWNPFYCIYADKVTVSGAKVFELKEMKVPYKGYFTMEYSTDFKAEGTKFIELQWMNPNTTNNWAMNPNSENANYNTISQFNILDPVIYNMTVETSFGDSEPHDVYVRVYGTKPINYWVSQ